MGIRGEIFSTRSSSKSERRTYFFNVKENRNGDIFLNVVESKKHGEADFERHQIVVFQEDLSEFLQAMGKAVEAMKPHHARRSEGRFTSDESSSGE
ncbi:MAG: PUR family DNA/RNA-binding protein [Spirochaetales bacterium]|nr:PUR family DNA/RNA-binding protein [Spirochaetales bacterium]